jgi:TolB-like protein
LAEELINQLGAVEPLKVTARTSSFAFRDADAGVTAIAQALGVGHVLEGSIASDGEALRVRARPR